jgi:nucleoside-diphosphate-sugar epimerase
MTNILIFGASGFIGRAIGEQLQKKTPCASFRPRVACCGRTIPA